MSKKKEKFCKCFVFVKKLSKARFLRLLRICLWRVSDIGKSNLYLKRLIIKPFLRVYIDEE